MQTFTASYSTGRIEITDGRKIVQTIPCSNISLKSRNAALMAAGYCPVSSLVWDTSRPFNETLMVCKP